MGVYLYSYLLPNIYRQKYEKVYESVLYYVT